MAIKSSDFPGYLSKSGRKRELICWTTSCEEPACGDGVLGRARLGHGDG